MKNDNDDYSRLNNLHKEIKNNCFIYVYSKDKNTMSSQMNYLIEYCQNWSLKPKKVIVDLGRANFVKNKPNLANLICNESNLDIIIYDITRLSRSTSDLYDIADICKENNIRIFDVDKSDFLFEDKFFNALRKYQEDLSI